METNENIHMKFPFLVSISGFGKELINVYIVKLQKSSRFKKFLFLDTSLSRDGRGRKQIKKLYQPAVIASMKNIF